MNNRKVRIFFALFYLTLAAFFVWGYPNPPKQQELKYYHNTGYVFGTYYNIRYEATKDLHKKIKKRLQEFDNSLSAFNEKSTLSLINQNKSDKTDKYFEQMYLVASQVYEVSNGAFDITVAPLVNTWGFGFKNEQYPTDQQIDSIRSYVGFSKISLENHRLQKQTAETMIDCGAIAKGQSCDVIADLLKKNGCQNLLVDIGGEVVCKGHNEQGQYWRVGITKPEDDLMGTNTDLEAIVSGIEEFAMATSGNYRQFYYDNGVRRSHTIDPRTGYPVQHSLLSATVIAPTCMRADALATACMVLGVDSAMQMIESLQDTECFLIYANGDSTKVEMTDKMKLCIQQK